MDLRLRSQQRAKRGTTNGNARGNSRDRAARRRWLVMTFAADRALRAYGPDGGDVQLPTCRCYRCGTLLDEETVTVDRIVPGCKGGKYVRGNIRPACAQCNSETGGALRGTA